MRLINKIAKGLIVIVEN